MYKNNMLNSWFTQISVVYLNHSNNLKKHNIMKDQIFTQAQKIAMFVIIALFLTAVILAKLNLFGFTAAQFTV